jgi:hypothetical protein
MRSEEEIKRALDRIMARTTGSYEELAGAEEALRWVLGDDVAQAMFDDPHRNAMGQVDEELDGTPIP